MAKKKQRINLIDRDGNSQVVEVNSTVSETPSKETKKSTISSAIRGGINRASSDARNYGPLVTVANTVNGLGLGATGSNLNKKDSKDHNLLDNALQVGKNVRAGVQSGLMSIPDSQLYEVRNSLQKGEKKAEETTNAKDSTKELLKSGGKALLYTLSPTLGQAVDNLSGNREYNEDDNAFQRALKSANNTYNVLGGTRGLGKTVEAAGQLYAENQERQGKNDKLSSKVENFQETIDKPAEDYAQQVQLENQNYSKPVQFLGNTGQTVGNMIPSMVVSAATKNPNAGLTTMFLQSKGSATKEALQNGADLDEANAIGTAKGGIEVGTEKLFGGIKFKGKSVYGSGSLDDITETALNKLIKNKTANFLVKQLGVNNVGEILEETISDIAGTIIDKNTTDPNASYSVKDWKNTALQTLASTLALNLLGGSFGRTSYNENLKSMSDTEIAQMQDALIKTSPEDIQRIVSKEVESINQKVQEGKLDAEQAQLAIETLQAGGQDLMENQAALQNEYGRPQNTLESKLEIVQNLDEVEKPELIRITQKIKNGEQLNIDEIATLQYLNSKGTPQAVENAPISNETTQPSAIPQETQNVAQNREINNNYASQDLEGPPVEEERTPYSKQMTQEEADEMQRAHSESLDRMADGRVGRTPGEQLIEDNNVSDRRVNAIQYDNPEIKKYYKQAAEVVGAEAYDAKNQSFQSGIREQQDELGRTEYRRYAGWNGFISKDLSDLARNNHLTARQIEKAANDIMEDNGKENNANAKKLEKVLDKRLREGYSAYGDNFEPNQDYINEMENIAYEKQRQGELESLEEGSEAVKTNETTQNNKQESTKEDSAFNLKEKQNEVKQVKNKSDLKEVVDEDLYDADIKDVENQIYREEYKLNEDVDDEDGPVGNYWDIDDTYFNLKNGNTLWLETPTEYGKLKNGKTNYNDEIHNKIKMFIEDTNGNIIDEYTLNNEKGEFTREDILNGIKQLTYNDSNKQPEGQIDMFGNVHVSKISDNVETAKVENNQQNIENQTKQENIPDKVEEQVIKSNAESDAKQTENEEIKQIENKEIKQTENKEIEQIENREVSKILQEVPKEQRPKINEKLKKWVFNIRQKFTDNQAALYDISREYKNPTLYHKADKILSVDAMAQNNLSKRQTDYHGKVYKNFIDENGNKVSMGFNKAYDMYNEIPNKVKSEFLVNMRNIDQLKNGIDQFQIPLQDSEKLVAEYRKKYKNIDKWGENIWTYGHNQLQNMVDMGMYTQEYADMYLESNPHYIHIDRKMPNNTSPLEQKGRNVTINNPIKHIKGSTREIMPIKETQAQFTREVYRSMAFNDLAQELVKTIGVSSNDGDINSLDEVFGINQKVLNEENGNYTLTIFNKGVRTTIPINKAIYESLQTRNVPKVPVLADFSNFQRDVLTGKNPYFALSNAAKDAGDMFLYSKHPIYKSLETYGKLFGGRTIGKTANAVNNKVNNQFNQTTTEQWIELYENRGNLSSSIFQNGEFKKEKGKVAKTITAPITGIEAINNFIESMPRITEFVNTIESYGYTMNSEGELVSKREAFIEKNKGKMSQEELQNKANKIKEPTKSLEKVLLEADYNAAEITTNFKRGGEWAKTLDKNGATFSSAAIQGAAKFGRTFTEAIGDARNGDFRAARRIASRVMALGVAPALINAIAYKDDDDYEELPDYVKEQYYLFKIKGTNDFIRVPKGRAVSIFESGAKRTIDAVKGKDKAFKGYDTLIMNQIAPNNPFESNVLAPWSAVKNNEAWSGNPIVSDYLEENFNPDKQYDAKTSEFSKWVGNKLKKVDLEDAPVVGAYLEALKTPKKLDYLIDQYSGVIGDILLPSTTNYAENENSSGFNALINPLKSKFKVNSTLTNKATSEYNALKKQIHRDSNDDDATNLVKAKDAYINNDYSDVKSHISSLYAKQREIQNNTKLSDSEKYKQNKQIQRELVDYMNSVMEDLENASEEDGVVSIGNKLYIKGKDSYGNEKMKEFNENKTSAAKEAGLPIKEYAKIDSAISNMEADKDSKGKSISGTKKKKAVQYLKEQGYNEEQIKAIVESYGWKY